MRRQKVSREQFGCNKQADEPAPREQFEAQVVPKRDEGKDEHECEHAVARAAERDVYVARDPEVVGAVPCAPEAKRGVVVRHAAHHVFRGVDAAY